MADPQTVSGTERAAILLLTLGEQTAASVLRHMDVQEVQKLGSAMAELTDVPRERVVDVLGELLIAVEAQDIDRHRHGRVSTQSAHGIAGRAPCEQPAGTNPEGPRPTGIDALKWMDARTVAEVIKNEHPQIIATILAHLDSRQAADMLDRFEPRRRPRSPCGSLSSTRSTSPR